MANSMTREYRSGAAVVLGQPEAHRATTATADLTHPRQLGARLGHVDVVALALADAAGALEHAGAVAAEHVGERVQLVRLGVGAGHRSAVGHLVQVRPAGGEAERSTAHRLVEQLDHRRHVVPVGSAWSSARSPIAYWRSAQWPTMPPTLMPFGIRPTLLRYSP